MDNLLEIARGRVQGQTTVNKYGRAFNGVQTTATDIWDLADATPTQQIWVAPTQARAHDIVSSDVGDVSAVATLTLTGNISDGSIVTIGTKVYTFQDTLTDVDGNVHIGGSASATLDNLIDAINLGAGAGTDYATSMTANSDVTVAVAGAGDTMTLYVTSAGAIATTTDDGSASWGGAVAVAGAGARTIRVFGLTAWNGKEETEDVALQGVTVVATIKTFVIIHRMKVLTKGATDVNIGNIKATAQTDSTITAQINASRGQTLMAIFPIPEGQTGYLTQIYGSLEKSAGASASIDVSLLVNPEPDTELINFLTKHTFSVVKDGKSTHDHKFELFKKIVGPAIVKLQGIASGADQDVSAGFDIILIDND